MIKTGLTGLGGILLLAATIVLTPQSRPESPPMPVQEAAAVGTFTTQDLLIAYYASPSFSAKMKALHAEHAEAKRKGDTAKVKELEDRGAALQERAHRQLAGEAPLTEILDVLRPAFPEIAREAGVGAIVVEFAWKSPAFKTVDVTAKLVERLKPAGK